MLRRDETGWDRATIIERTGLDEWTVEYDDGGQAWRTTTSSGHTRRPALRERAAAVLRMYATVQEVPPDHRGGHTLGRDELVVEEAEYDQALVATRRLVPEGWRIIALRVERG